MTILRKCILTGYPFNPIEVDETTEPVFEYQFSPVGKVQIELSTLLSFMENNQYHHPILAGLCRNAFENDIDPPIINQELIDNGIKNVPYPKSFKEKCRHLLEYMYYKGGKDFKSFTFISTNDYPICYAENHEEFSKILSYLKTRFLIEWRSDQSLAGGKKRYFEIQLMDLGIEEVEKDLPKIPLIGLIDQKITTGNYETDEKINHAKNLFFHEPQTVDRMRSACETLSYVLEPLRQDVKKYFNSKDTEDFFNLVNNFDIRHNKEKTKEIEHSEQLEWVFYSLLNTINTYTKLKQRLGK